MGHAYSTSGRGARVGETKKKRALGRMKKEVSRKKSNPAHQKSNAGGICGKAQEPAEI